MSGLRIDKFLFFARFFKTRSLAAGHVEAGEVLINDQTARKPAQNVKPGDVVIFPAGKKRRRVLVLALGERRGPAPEAQSLYQELDPPPPLDPWGEDGV